MRRRGQGSALLLSVVVMSALLVLIMLALEATSRGARQHDLALRRDQAFYLAEAGRQRAITTLARTGTWPAAGQEFALGPGTYTVDSNVSVSGLVWSYTLTSRGRVPGPSGPVDQTVTQRVDVRRFLWFILGCEVVDGTWRRL